MRHPTMGRPGSTQGWRVQGPGGPWSIWDFGDEMTVHEGPGLLDRAVARVRPELCRRLDDEERWAHVESAASAIHTAKLLAELVGDASPTFRHLWTPARG